jgi:cell division protein FtsB
MISPLLDIFVQYSGAVIAGLLVGLLCKAYFAHQMSGKISGYQGDIVKSHSRILRLESTNEQLEKRIKELEGQFPKDRIFMN